ncbi:MAG: hypothetical protein KC413_11070, partial [Anaerolineales bacterium]|nr:hypothetical protein [Anaerolineales bacterium]
EMLHISGLTGAAPLWSEYMQAVYADYGLLESLWVDGMPPANEFTPPSGVEKRPLCSLSSVVVGATDCTQSGSEWFLEESVAKDEEPTLTDAVTWEQLEPAVWRMPAAPLPPLPLEVVNPEADEDAPPSQLFCHFAQGTAVAELPANALPQVFLSPPRNEESLKAAHEWAQANNIALLPTAVCNEELLALARDPNIVAVYRITTPKAGDNVNGVLPIVGTADFDPAVVQFYKIELGIPQSETDIQWVTLGETHTTPVVNGTLEMLHADALPPGDYFLRLIVIKDSNYVGEPHTIQITIGS